MVKPATDTPTTLEAGTAHHKIRSMAVAGGFLDDAEFDFADGLHGASIRVLPWAALPNAAVPSMPVVILATSGPPPIMCGRSTVSPAPNLESTIGTAGLDSPIRTATAGVTSRTEENRQWPR